ncbi:MAG: hypothetical protein QF733_01600 [Phycisphaerales bacterium]|jgi:hypothetical protein|nr:hypothetical protein [Phycisphaerales bacterium]
MRRGSCVALVFFLVGPAASGQMAAFKQIGAAAEDVHLGRLAPPDPASHGAVGRCASIPFVGTGEPLTLSLDVPACAHLAVVPIGESSVDWSLALVDPSGVPLDLTSDRVRHGRAPLWPLGPGESDRWDISDPAAGAWTATLSGVGQGQQGVLLVRDDLPAHLRSTLSTYQVLAGEPVRVTAWFEATAPKRSAPVAVSSEMRVVGSDEPLAVTMSRGVISGELRLPEGEHVICVDAAGVDPVTGTMVRRTTHHMVRVEADPPVLDGGVGVAAIDEHRVAITLSCSEVGSRDRVLAGAEVWSDGELRCWIGGMSRLDRDGVHLVLDTRWLQGAGAEVRLRNVRVADPKSAVTLARAADLSAGAIACDAVPITPAARQIMQKGAGDQGGMPLPGPERAAIGGHNLMLVHGYCSGGNPWPTSDFSGELSVYHNPDQNFSNDTFALDILAFGQQFKSFSIAGHSQGGNAGLHLYAFYWSGLDWATPSPQDGGRLVQALGAPLRGTALAGSIAALGEIFGIQCGANYDMTYDGAALWLSYVPTWARQECWSWTTTFTDDWWSWDYCHIAADLILADPEDGVVEGFSGDIDGGNYLGLKEGWCHIEGMTDPPQTGDSTRNSEINAEAAR